MMLFPCSHLFPLPQKLARRCFLSFVPMFPLKRDSLRARARTRMQKINIQWEQWEHRNKGGRR